MSKPFVCDDLWAVLAPLLPPEPFRHRGDRPRRDDRAVLAGTVVVLRSGIAWEMLPRELCCSGMPCWRRLRDGQEASVWAGLQRVLLARLSDAGHLDWSRASLDSASVAAKREGSETGPNLTDRGRPGLTRHLVVDRKGTPLGVRLSPANRHDSLMLMATLDAVPGMRRGRGRPRKRADKLHVDKAYDHRRCRRECRVRSIAPRVARRGVETSERLGRPRWVVERTLAWLSCFRRLAIRYERRADIHEVFVILGCALICLSQIRQFCQMPSIGIPVITQDVRTVTRFFIVASIGKASVLGQANVQVFGPVRGPMAFSRWTTRIRATPMTLARSSR